MFDGLDFPGNSDEEDVGPATSKRARTARPGTSRRDATAKESKQVGSDTPASFAAATASFAAATAQLASASQNANRNSICCSGTLSADEELAQMIQAQAHTQQICRTPKEANTLQLERSSATAAAVTPPPDATGTRAAAPPRSSEIQCGICGVTPSSAPWCYEASLGGQILELTSACTLCVIGVQVVCPSLSWAQAEQLASLSPAFKTGIPVAGKIQQALVPQVRTQKQFMDMVGGLAKHGRELGDAFSRVCLALDVKPKTSERSLETDSGVSAAEEQERRLARTLETKPQPKRARAAASGSSSLPSALMQFDGKGKISRQAISAEAAQGTQDDKHSYAYHSKKIDLEAILSGKVQKAANIINAVEKSGKMLIEDHTGLRKSEGAALLKLARAAAAADLLSERKQLHLDHDKFMHNLKVLKEAHMKSYPAAWCRLVWRRMLMQTGDPKAFLDMVSVWAQPVVAFDPMKPQLLSLPAGEGEGNCFLAAFTDAIEGDLMPDAMRPPLSASKLNRMWCIAQDLHTALEANSAVAAERLGAYTFAGFKEIATALCAVSALIPASDVLPAFVNRPAEANLQAKSIMEALKKVRTASAISTEGQAHRQQVAELLGAPPWEQMADTFLRLVVKENANAGRRESLVAKMGGAGVVPKEDVEATVTALRELHHSTRQAWLQPLAIAFTEFALQAGESAKTSKSADEVCLARGVLQSVLDLTAANILQASTDAAEALLQEIEPRAIELEREAEESRFTQMADALRSAIHEGNVTKEQVLEMKSWPRWATPPPKVAETLEKLAGCIFSYAGGGEAALEMLDTAICREAALEMLDELLFETSFAGADELLRTTKALRSALMAKAALATLEESKAELNHKQRGTMVKAAIKLLQSTKAAFKSLDEIQPVLSRLGAESALETLQVAMTGRDAVLLDHLRARRQHCEAALVSATAELKACNQGGADSKSWYEGIANDDLDGLKRVSPAFFQHFSADQVQMLVKKTRAATKACREALYEPDLASLAEASSAVEASSAAAALPPSVFEATEAIERAEITIHEAHMLAAVVAGGDEGRNQCRACLDNLVAGSELSVEKVHPALMKEVHRLLAQGQK